MNENPTAEPTVAESQEVQDTTLNAEITENPEQTVETTEKPLGEILQDEQVKESVKPDFKELYKTERREKRQTLAELKELREKVREIEESRYDGVSEKEIKSSLDDLSEEYNVDKDFLKKQSKILKEELRAEMQDDFKKTLEPLTRQQKEKEYVETATIYFNNALERMPEFKGIAQLQTILDLGKLEKNQQKTVSQLIEETFGSAITGKKTIESSTVRGTVEPTEVDYAKAKTDSEYFKEVMANPVLKKKYNDGLAQRVLR
jgi:hypothetical protein